MTSARGVFQFAQNIELATVAVGIDHEEAVAIGGVFDLFALNEQAPTVPGVFFAGGVEGLIALDQEDVGVDGAVAGRGAFEVFVAAYRGIGGNVAEFPIPLLGGGTEQQRE